VVDSREGRRVTAHLAVLEHRVVTLDL